MNKKNILGISLCFLMFATLTLPAYVTATTSATSTLASSTIGSTTQEIAAKASAQQLLATKIRILISLIQELIDKLNNHT